MLDRITPLILTYNEAPNIARVLERLRWARRIVVLDSGSDDGTMDIARCFPNVAIHERQFDSHAAQWNFGLRECGIDSEWVLALDADYVLPDAAIEELRGLRPASGVGAYRARFRYLVAGRVLTGSLYPPVSVLFRREGAEFQQEGHTQRVSHAGAVVKLHARIDHDDRKPLGRWLQSQERYAELEARLLQSSRWRNLRWQDRLRCALVITPWLVPLYVLFLRACLFDGWAGWHYAFQRGLAETVLSLKLIEARLGTRTGPHA